MRTLRSPRVFSFLTFVGRGCVGGCVSPKLEEVDDVMVEAKSSKSHGAFVIFVVEANVVSENRLNPVGMLLLG